MLCAQRTQVLVRDGGEVDIDVGQVAALLAAKLAA